MTTTNGQRSCSADKSASGFYLAFLMSTYNITVAIDVYRLQLTGHTFAIQAALRVV